MKRILYVITKAEIGGAQNHVFELIVGFNKDAHVALAVGFDGLLADRARDLGIPVYIIPSLERSINPLQDISAIQEVRAILKDFEPDIVHAHSTKAGFISRIAARLENVPVVFTAHGWVFAPGVPPLIRFVVWLMELIVAPLSSRIICVSDYDRQLALNWLPIGKQKIEVIPYGIAAEAPQAEPSQEPPILIMPARFQQQKDQPMLIRSLAKVSHRNFKVLFAGTGPLIEESKALVQKLGLDEQIEFLGNRTDMELLLSQSQVFVLFSRYEGLPVSIMEAMRAGLPVLANDVCGVKEEVEHGCTGYLVKNGDDATAADFLEKVINDAELRKQLGIKAREKFLNEFTAVLMVQRMRSVYAKAYRKTSQPIETTGYYSEQQS